MLSALTATHVLVTARKPTHAASCHSRRSAPSALNESLDGTTVRAVVAADDIVSPARPVETTGAVHSEHPATSTA